MSNLLDKIMVVDGEAVELSLEIKERMEQVFNDAVEKQCDNHYLEGIEDVLENMKKHGMSESADIVERNLIDDGVIEPVTDTDEEPGEDSKKDRKQDEAWIYEIVKMIG